MLKIGSSKSTSWSAKNGAIVFMFQVHSFPISMSFLVCLLILFIIYYRLFLYQSKFVRLADCYRLLHFAAILITEGLLSVNFPRSLKATQATS